MLVHRDGSEHIMCDWCYEVGPPPETMKAAGWVSFQAPRGPRLAPADNCPKCKVPHPKAKPVSVAPEGAVRTGAAA